MARRQQQMLGAVCSLFPGAVDLLSLGASEAQSRKWLEEKNVHPKLLGGFYPRLAQWNALFWYAGGVLLCNKLRCIRHFHFPLRTPIPRSWLDRYELILCFYPWAYRLVGLRRAGSKVIVDAGDVMADRHHRTGARRWISLTSKHERAVITSTARCIAISQDDRDEFMRLYGRELPVVSFVPPDFAELNAVASEPGRPATVGFMGAPSYVNEEILRTLSEPAFLQRLSVHGIELLIAGGICSTAAPSILSALQAGGAKILGRVRSTLDYYRQISATVNPVGPSTGVKIKSVETLIAGRALITTKWGADSLLAEAFPGQVLYTDWPIDAEMLADLCAAAVQNAGATGPQAGIAYAQQTSQALREVLSA
jgi:hypothetical protein